MPLDVPAGFGSLTPEDKAIICNGAGAKGGIKVPNTMWGLDMRTIFDVHDYDYWCGETVKDKRDADRRMLINAIILIMNRGGLLAVPRVYRAATYFCAVAFMGEKAFWKGKNSHGV